MASAVTHLKEATATFAAREAGLRKQRALRTSTAKANAESAREHHAISLSAALKTAALSTAERRAQITAHHEQRDSRIAYAAAGAEHALAHAIEEEKGRSIGHSQSTTLEARRSHAALSDELKRASSQFSADLAEDRATYARLRSGARSAFRGFPKLSAKFSTKHQSDPAPSRPEDVTAVQIHLRNKLLSAARRLEIFRKRPLPALFRLFPLQWVAPLALSTIAVGGLAAGWASHQFAAAGGIAGAALLVLWLLQRAAAAASKNDAEEIDAAFHEIVLDYQFCREHADSHFQALRDQLDADLARSEAEMQQAWAAASAVAEAKRSAGFQEIATRKERALAKNTARQSAALSALNPGISGNQGHLHSAAEAEAARIEADFQNEIANIEAEFDSGIAALAAEWQSATAPHLAALEAVSTASSIAFPAWSADYIASWSAPRSFHHAARFGSLTADLPTLAGAAPQDPRFALPGGDGTVAAPLTLRFPDQGCLLLETATSGSADAIGTLNAVILRLLAAAPPGKINFSIIDPVSLGQNFAGITHLADYEDNLINGRIWTSREQIEKRLAELNEHMEKVIQMYLRNEYTSIYDYNEQAGNIAEKYHFLVIADFPAECSELAAKRLLSIVKSGARCGIYTLIHHDSRRPFPDGISADDLRANSIRISQNRKGTFQINSLAGDGIHISLDSPPPPNLATDLIRRVGDASTDSNRIEVPFAHIAPPEGALWTNETTDELRIPIGRTGATKLQYLALGKGTRQHALFAGKTGSGKSTLFHVIITNLALSCDPDQVEFYLVDFKKGVEFKCYASHHLPHARVIAIESDREFGLSVLQRLDDELKRRGELFRNLSVQDIAGFKKAGGGAMPRTLLMIDEFQEFFVEEDRIAQGASVLLDRIVRQGRAFGIHVILGSQTLGGAYSLARATLGQMVVRVALQCNEADAYLIMDDSNPAPRLLTRPGEGIYNDSAGAVEANSPFQTVWLPEAERDARLAQIATLAASSPKHFDAPVVFEGNAPADVTTNPQLARWISSSPAASPSTALLPLGAPNAIKGPTTAEFRSQSGNHLLIVGQRDDAVLAMFGVGLVALSSQFPQDAAKFVLIDGSPPDSPERAFFAGIAKAMRHPLTTSYSTDIAAIMSDLAADQKCRSDDSTSPAPPTFVFINGLQRFKKLRHDEDLAFSFDASSDGEVPSIQLNDLICEGAPLGLHLIASIDSFNNVGRSLSRKSISEFEMRILFQMSANDSAALIDSPKASSLGMHRALFYNGHEGYLETFRPYAPPPHGWAVLP